jgi:hypothetical protein
MDMLDGLIELSEKGNPRGALTGFQCLKNLISFRPGYTTYIGGTPFSGKSELGIEFIINFMDYYSQRSVIFSPETGNKLEIMGEILHKVSGKNFYSKYGNQITPDEISKAVTNLQQYIKIIDTKYNNITIPQFYEIVKEIETDGFRVNYTFGDPFNEFSRNKVTNMRDVETADMLRFVAKDARDNKRHNIISMHIKGRPPIRMKNGQSYMPVALAEEWAEGQEIFRKGQQMILTYRPSRMCTDPETSEPYEDNISEIHVQKSKPKGIGKIGNARLYWDYKKSRYSERIDGFSSYAQHVDDTINNEPQGERLVPSGKFNDTVKEEPFEIPF